MDFVETLKSRTNGTAWIVKTISAWLAELDATSPLVDELASTVRTGNGSAAHAIADRLSVDVTVAA